MNGDEIVDGMDIDILVEHWHTDDPLCDIAPPPYGDGIVDAQDLIEVGEHLFEEVYPPELIAYWKLDEAEGEIAYNRVSDNHGVLSGHPTWQPETGRINGALAFEGMDDAIEAGFVLDPSQGPFSVFAWVKGGAPGQVILSQSGGDDWLLIADNGTLQTNLIAPQGRFQTLSSEALVVDDAWQWVGLVWDGVNRILFLDGAEVARDTYIQVGLNGSTGNLFIGTGRTRGTGTFFSGLIDDVRIYNRAVRP